jgi:hypothetical protein
MSAAENKQLMQRIFTTKAGTPYNNTYCFVVRLCLDTELVTAALGDPGT